MTVVVEYKHEPGKAPTIHFGKGAVHCFLRKVRNTRQDETLYVLNMNRCNRTDLENATKEDWEQVGTLWFRPYDFGVLLKHLNDLGATEIK